MSPDGMENSVDPYGAVWSGSALFAQTCLSENLRNLWYMDEIYGIYCENKFYKFKSKCSLETILE